MLKEDKDKFDAEAVLQDAARAADHFDRCAGVDLPSVEELQRTIFNDLSPSTFGIAWWEHSLPTRQRILISDYLVACPRAVIMNLVEANLHFLEARAEWAEQSRRLARVIDTSGRFALPEVKSATDQLAERHATMHVAGVFRAVGSVLDCLAATVIGVLPMPISIVKADFSRMMKWLRGEQGKSVLRSAVQIDFKDRLEQWTKDAGPTGWLEWADDYRNTLVHRPRRVELYMLKPESVLVDVQHRPIPRVNVIPVLAGEPDLSDVEAIRKQSFSLTEDANDTIVGLLASVHRLCADVGGYLQDRWKARRSNRDPQPVEQWADGGQVLDGFSGYAPKTVSASIDQLRTSQQWVRRLSAAAMTPESSHVWNESEIIHANPQP